MDDGRLDGIAASFFDEFPPELVAGGIDTQCTLHGVFENKGMRVGKEIDALIGGREIPGDFDVVVGLVNAGTERRAILGDGPTYDVTQTILWYFSKGEGEGSVAKVDDPRFDKVGVAVLLERDFGVALLDNDGASTLRGGGRCEENKRKADQNEKCGATREIHQVALEH